jgi:hypothetical protein
MDSTALLQKFESLTHSERVREMVSYGEQSRDNGSVKEWIDGLSSADLYGQALSLESCYGSRDMSIAIRLMQSPSKYLKKRAIQMIVLAGTDEELVQALKTAPIYLQIRTIRRMRGLRKDRRRLKAIEMFLGDLENDHEERALFQKLFLFGSEDLVRRNLGTPQSISDDEWTLLIKYHPSIAQGVIIEWAKRVDYDDILLGNMVETHVRMWTEYPSELDRLLNLVKVLLEKIPIGRFPIQELALKCPEMTVHLILDCKDELSSQVVSDISVKVLQRLPMELFLPLFQRYPDIVTKRKFKDLRPNQRFAVYKVFRQGWRDEDGVIEEWIVAELPKKERILEARRHIKLRTFETRPEGRSPYIAFLPWEEAIELQMPLLRDSDADIRGLALREQIAAAKWDDARLSDAIQLIMIRKNEQDPVKSKMMDALKEIPLGRWKAEHLEGLGQIIRNTLDTGDTSSLTVQPLLQIVTDLLPAFPKWGKAQLETMTQERGEIPRWERPTGNVSIEETMRVFAEALSPLLKKLLANNSGHHLYNLAQGFGKHTVHWTEFLDTCEKMLEIHEMVRWRLTIVQILKAHRPKTWSSIIPRLISENEPTAGMPMLLMHVHRHQQNLLWEKYITSSCWWAKEALNDLTGGFWRWTAEQQAGFAILLIADLSNADKPESDKVRAVKQLGLLTHFTIMPLVDLANDASRPVLQEAALRSLGRLDDDRGISTVIGALSDQRARIAIYALRSSLRRMSKAAALTLLQSIPQTQITVAKETVRLIGELESEPALQHLLSVSENKKLHSDVQISLLRALWPYLERATATVWEVFAGAAKSDVIGVARAVANIPHAKIEKLDRDRVLHLMLLLLEHNEGAVRRHALQSCESMSLQDPNQTLTPRLFELVRSELKDEARAAAKVLFTSHIGDEGFVGKMYEGLIGNQLLLRRVHDEVYLEMVSPEDSNKNMRGTTHAILAVLAKDRLSVARRVKTLFRGLPWAEIKPYFWEMVGGLHADALVLASGFLAAERNEGWWGGQPEGLWRREGDAADLKTTEMELAGSANEWARRLGLSMLVGRASGGKGWSQEDRSALEKYKLDESALIAEAAWGVVIPDVQEEEDEEEEEKKEDEKGEVGGQGEGMVV